MPKSDPITEIVIHNYIVPNMFALPVVYFSIEVLKGYCLRDFAFRVLELSVVRVFMSISHFQGLVPPTAFQSLSVTYSPPSFSRPFQNPGLRSTHSLSHTSLFVCRPLWKLNFINTLAWMPRIEGECLVFPNRVIIFFFKDNLENKVDCYFMTLIWQLILCKQKEWIVE